MFLADGSIGRLTDECMGIRSMEQPSNVVPLMPKYDIDVLSHDTVVFEFRYRSLGSFVFNSYSRCSLTHALVELQSTGIVPVSPYDVKPADIMKSPTGVGSPPHGCPVGKGSKRRYEDGSVDED